MCRKKPFNVKKISNGKLAFNLTSASLQFSGNSTVKLVFKTLREGRSIGKTEGWTCKVVCTQRPSKPALSAKPSKPYSAIEFREKDSAVGSVRLPLRTKTSRRAFFQQSLRIATPSKAF